MIKINLLAEAKPQKKKKGVAALGGAGRLNAMLLFGAVLLGLLVIGIQWWLLNAQTKELDEKIRIAKAEVQRLESVLKEVKDFEDKKARLQKKVDLINELKRNQTGPVRLMDEVSKALPDLLWLEKMEMKGTSITVSGRALNPPAVANFVTNLKLVPYFQEPKGPEITASGTPGQTLYNFSLSFIFANLDKTQFEPGAKPASPATASSGAAPAPAATAGGQK